jgi:phosphohistidine phosphatase
MVARNDERGLTRNEPLIYFLRHGEAEPDASDDAARRLTKKGKRQAKVAGKALNALGAKPEICLTSPKARARQTAKRAAKQLGIEVEVAEQLSGGPFGPTSLAAGRDVLLVGHEPDFSNAIAELTGGRVNLRKGGIACVEDRVLHDLLEPEQLRLIAKGA